MGSPPISTRYFQFPDESLFSGVAGGRQPAASPPPKRVPKIENNLIYKNESFVIWKERWKERLKINNNTPEKYLRLMQSVNPLVIPRNHKVEEALKAANDNNLEPIKRLIEVLEKPYINQENILEFQSADFSKIEKYQTFCGT